MDAEFEIIKQAREMLKGNDPEAPPPSAKTVAGYEKEWLRLLERGNKNPSKVLEAARDTRASSTWYRRKAAAIHGLTDALKRLLAGQDRLQRQMKGNPEMVAQWQQTVASIKRVADALADFKSAPPLPKDERKPRTTKKRSLKGLPEDWRERLAERLPKYRVPYLVTACTGLRPDELAKGVDLVMEQVNGRDMIVVKIPGSKYREGLAGQERREIAVELDGKEGSLASQLHQVMLAGATSVQIESPQLFSNAIRDAGRREWPGRKSSLSAYSLRHQFSADLKGAGWSNEEIAVALGHRSTKTGSYYGDRRQARGGVKVNAAKGSNKVLKNHKKPG